MRELALLVAAWILTACFIGGAVLWLLVADMKTIKRWWRAATEYLGWSLPSEVAPGYPTTFKDFQARRAELQLTPTDRQLVDYWNKMEVQRRKGQA